MGKQQKARLEKKRANSRLEALRRLNLPVPEDLKSDPASQALIAIYVEAVMRFAEGLPDVPTLQSLKQSVHASMLFLDELLSRIPSTVNFEGSGPATLACQKGCNHCCTIRVTATAPTILALGAYLRKRLTADRLAALIERLNDHVEEGLRLSAVDQVLVNRMCPLNEDGLCVGYEYRPTSCRAYHSFSLERCIEDRESAVKGANVPQDPRRTATHQLVARAMDDCTRALGFDTKELEFAPALLIALSAEGVGDRYLAGEDVFAPAHRPEVIHARVAGLNQRGLVPLRQVG